MTTTTLTALTTQSGVRLQYVVAIEGYGYLLTNGAAADAITAWAGTDYIAALSGLEIQWSMDQKLDPWNPFKGMAHAVTLAVMDTTGADTFGLAVFKREGQTTSRLLTDITPTSTTLSLQSTDAFPSTAAGGGTVYIGNEAIVYTTNDTAADTLTGLTRGCWSPFTTEAGGRFARTHRVTPTVPGIPPDASTSTIVADAPIDWKGRWVGIWIHRVVDGVLDIRTQAHLAFAGKLAAVSDGADGRTIVQCEGVQEAIADAIVMREQWKAKVRPGIYMLAGDRISAATSRGATVLQANDLVVVSSGAAGSNQINEGFYDAAAVETAINAWLSAEKTATRLLFKLTFKALDDSLGAGEVRSSLKFSDPTGGTLLRAWRMNSGAGIADFMGWAAGGIGGSFVATVSAVAYSAFEPKGVSVHIPNALAIQSLHVQHVTGSFISQAALLPPDYATHSMVAIMRVGNFYVQCRAPSITAGAGSIVVGGIVGTVDGGPPVGGAVISLDNGTVEIAQVLYLSAPVPAMVLDLLASTGGGANWAAYDVLPEQASAAIPYALMGTGLLAELNAMPGAGDPLRLIVDKPTPLADLFNVPFVLRLNQLVWRQGRIALKGFATPTSAATLTISSDARATPIDTSDDLRAVIVESDQNLRNCITIKINSSSDRGAYVDSTTLIDPGSASNFGGRPMTLTIGGAGALTAGTGEDIDALLPTFAAGLAYLGRPMWIVKVPIDMNLFETATAGEVCLLSDPFTRDPATGTRSLTGKPALIIGNRYDYNTATGEIDVMLFPRLSIAPYSPCAAVDDTAPTGGYVAGTKVLTCYAHSHSDASEVADATRFPAGSKVVVVERDPAVAAAPQTWSDTVASQSGNTITLTTGLAGWVAATRYRVISADYATAVTAQRTDTYQADDADGLVENLRAPYSVAFFGAGQASTYVASVATELPSRPPTLAYGDGKPLDTGHAYDLAAGLNNLLSYKQAPQQPEALGSTEVMSYSGAGTWRLVWCEPVYVGPGRTSAAITRKLYVSPTVTKAGAASADIRVTLARKPPRASDPSNLSRDDVFRILPYFDHTFTTTSAIYETPTPYAFGIDHLPLGGSGPMVGIGWLYVEVANHASFRGFGVKYLGPTVAP